MSVEMPIYMAVAYAFTIPATVVGILWVTINWSVLSKFERSALLSFAVTTFIWAPFVSYSVYKIHCITINVIGNIENSTAEAK